MNRTTPWCLEPRNEYGFTRREVKWFWFGLVQGLVLGACLALMGVAIYTNLTRDPETYRERIRRVEDHNFDDRSWGDQPATPGHRTSEK